MSYLIRISIDRMLGSGDQIPAELHEVPPEIIEAAKRIAAADAGRTVQIMSENRIVAQFMPSLQTELMAALHNLKLDALCDAVKKDGVLAEELTRYAKTIVYQAFKEPLKEKRARKRAVRKTIRRG